MAEAKATIPHFQVQIDVAIDAALALRAQFKAVAGDATPPSLNDLIVRACALALRDRRIVNGADASRFLSDVKDRLETPLRLAL